MNLAKATTAAAALALSSLAMTATPVLAQTAEIAVGATVTGNDGNPVGTVSEVRDGAVVVDTGTYKIPLPAESYGEGETGPTLNITKEALNQTWSEQLAAAEAALAEKLVVGAPVLTYDSQPLGTVEELAEGGVILDDAGEKINLPRDMFALDPNGSLIVLATMAQIEEAKAANQAG